MNFAMFSRRWRTPTVIQMEAVECGAAALCSILGYHGLHVPLEKLRAQCGVSRDGSKAVNLLKVARQYGFEAKAWRKEPAGLREFRHPCILFWNFNHFVVFEGFDRRGNAWINDPGIGPTKVPSDEFDRAFTGLALGFAPGPQFQRGGTKASLWPALLRRMKGMEAPAVFLFLAGLFLVIPGLVIPTFSQIFIDDILVRGEEGWLRPLLVGMGVALLLQLVLNLLQQGVLLRLETKLALVSSSQFFRHLLRLPVAYFTQRYAGEIGSRVSLNDEVADLLAGSFLKIFLDLLMIGFFGVLMWLMDPWLFALVAASAVANLVILKVFARFRTDSAQRSLAEWGKVEGSSINGIALIETLKASGAEDDFFSRWAGLFANARRVDQEIQRFSAKMDALPALLGGLVSAGILVLGGLRIMDGLLTAGALVAFQALSQNFSGPVASFFSFGAQLQTLKGSMLRIDDVLAHEEDIRYSPSAAKVPLQRLAGRLEMRGVVFGYSKLEPPLLDGFDLVLEPGRRIALVGGSGSGKSTVAKLATGLFQPWKGEVLFDGTPFHELSPALLSSSIGVVDQEILLFEGTIRENLTLWDATIPDEALLRACRDAAIDDCVSSRAGGFDAKVLENGTNFSGGQRQRLEIARALVHDPALLVLDEATSALDANTEQQIDTHLRRRGCSCLIVAHRLSTIRDADEIIVMAQGKIVQRGQFEALKSVPGPFADLIRE